MNILLIGSGAREHAIARAIRRSTLPHRLICFGGSENPGIQALAEAYVVGDITDSEAVRRFALKERITWAIVGPEAPLAAGVVDALRRANIPSIGPTKNLARLETSKSFTRQLLVDYRIPVFPRFRSFTGREGVKEFIRELHENYVIKADGLMGGKGVKISGEHLPTIEDGLAWCDEILAAKQAFLIEEKLIGQEFSLMSFCDGTHLVHMPPVQDHKRAYNGDTGPNTGGMGSYSDANHLLPFLTESDVANARTVTEQVAAALRDRCGEPYIGILYGGFMATREGVRLIEYNARFGDPEAINVLAILDSDFVAICRAMLQQTIHRLDIRFRHEATVCKYVVPNGYPDRPIKDQLLDISRIEEKNTLYFGAVRYSVDGLRETGSRAIAIVNSGSTIAEAEEHTERSIAKISGPVFHRRDIGTAALIQERVEMMSMLRHSP